MEARVTLGGTELAFPVPVVGLGPGGEPFDADPVQVEGEKTTLPLVAVAHGRSGDKGADVNIGVRARHPDLYDVLVLELTEEVVAAHLSHLGASAVSRYLLPGIHALNFVLVGGLGEGGTASLRFDPQGKAVAQQLLDLEIEVPQALSHLGRL